MERTLRRGVRGLCLLVVVGSLVAGVGPASALDSGTAPTLDDGSAPERAAQSGHQVFVVHFQEQSSDGGVASPRDGQPTARGQGQPAVRGQAQPTAREHAPLEAYAASRGGVEIRQYFEALGAALVAVDSSSATAADLEAVDGVQRVTENFAIEPPAEGERESSGSQLRSTASGDAAWGVERVGAPSVWREVGVRGEDVRVAVLDTGVDPDHPDVTLADDGWAEFNSTGARIDSEPYDADGHGTKVSSVVAGGNASGQHIGVAPNATLLHGGVFTPEGGTFVSLLAGLNWAVRKDADVVSISVGAEGYHDEFVEPIRRAERAGTLVVAASGNVGNGSSYSPANVREALAVGATTPSGDVRSDSSGERVDAASAWSDPPADWPASYVVPDVVAPGQEIPAADAGGGYATVKQTSAAAPHASGAAALLLSAHPGLSPQQARALLTASASRPANASEEPGPRYGHGVVDARRAIRLAGNRSTLTGTVTGANGTPIDGATVTVGGSAEAVTGQNGTYSLQVPSGNRSLVVSGFGIERTRVSVRVDENGSRRNVRVASRPEVEVVESPPSTVEPGASFDVTLRVAGVEEYVPTVANGSLANATLADGTLGAARDIGHLRRGETVTATVRTDPGEIGSIALGHAFRTSRNETVRVETRATTAITDPIAVGENGTTASLERALAVAVNGSTIELREESYDLRDVRGPLTVSESVTITAAEGATPVLTGLGSARRRGDVALRVSADDVVVSDVALRPANATVGLLVAGADGVVLRNLTIGNATLGVGVRGSVDRLANATVRASDAAVTVTGSVGRFEGNDLAGESVDLSVERGGTVSVARESVFGGNGTGVAVRRGGAVRALASNEFEGTVGVDATGAVTSTRNDYSGVADVAIRSDGRTVVSRLDYYGPSGPAPGSLDGAVRADVFLTAPPSSASDARADVQRFGYRLELEAGEPTAIAFPAPLANPLGTTFGDVEGTIYRFERGRWRPVRNGHYQPEALEAFVVTPTENATVFVEYEAADGRTTPGALEVEEGWNFVGAPTAGDAETSFAASSADPARIMRPFAAPSGPLRPGAASGDWLSYTFESATQPPALDPHAGYFVYASRDGSVAANTYPGVTLDEFQQLVYGDAPATAHARRSTRGVDAGQAASTRREQGSPSADQADGTATAPSAEATG